MFSRIIRDALVLALLLEGMCWAQSITKEQLLKMHTAGISDSVIIHHIEANGIAFSADSDTLIGLRASGLSDRVLDAVVRAKSTPSVVPTNPPDEVTRLYSQHRYADLADTLVRRLQDDPNNDRQRAILMLTLLRLDKKEDALKQYDILKSRPSAAPYLAKIDNVFASFSAQKEARARVEDALSRLSVAAFRAAVESISASPLQKQMLRANVAVMTGDFDGAKKALHSYSQGSYSEQQQLNTLEEKVNKLQQDYATAWGIADKYIHSPAMVTMCMRESAADRHLSIPEYLQAVQHLAAISPLSEDVLALNFHAAMISSKYEEVEQLGDKLLSGNGHIKVPFYASDRFFNVVIDAAQKRVFTEADPHPFLTLAGKNREGWNSDMAEFNLGFDQITEISQKAGGSLAGAVWKNPFLLVKDAYALKLSPQGLAPEYALMSYLQCSLGQSAQENATYNLGRFVQHATGNAHIKAKLVKPKEFHSDAGAPFLQAAMAAQPAASQSPLMSIGTQALSQSMSQMDADVRAARAAWSSIQDQATEGFSVFDSPAIKDFESILGLVAPAGVSQ